MELVISEQVWALGICALAGALLGFVYDLGRILRGRFRFPGVTPLCDAVFWLAATVTAAFLVMRVLGGELRLFALFGLGCGLVVYSLTLSPLVVRMGFAILTAIAFVIRLILTPLRLLLRFIRLCAAKTRNFFAKLAKKLFPSGKKWCMIGVEYPENEGGRAREEETEHTPAAGSARGGGLGGGDDNAAASRHRRSRGKAGGGAARNRPPEA